MIAFLHLLNRDGIPERFEIWPRITRFTDQRSGNARDLIGTFANPSAAFDAAKQLHPALAVYCDCPNDFPYRMRDRDDVRPGWWHNRAPDGEA